MVDGAAREGEIVTGELLSEIVDIEARGRGRFSVQFNEDLLLVGAVNIDRGDPVDALQRQDDLVLDQVVGVGDCRVHGQPEEVDRNT